MSSWGRIYQEKGEFQTELREDMIGLIDDLKKKGCKNILDIGCGTGRYAFYATSINLNVTAIDNAEESIKICCEKSKNLGNKNIKFELGDCIILKYPDNCFDAVLCLQVIQHLDFSGVKKAFSETERVLKKGGTLMMTVQSVKGTDFSNKKKVAENTYVKLEGVEKDVLHYYFTEQVLRNLLSNFSIRLLKYHNPPAEFRPGEFANEYLVVAEKI